MKNPTQRLHSLFIVLIFYIIGSLSFTSLVYAQIDETKELAAILKVIETETDCFYSRNYECWKETWVPEAHAFQAWSNPNGTFDARSGWETVDKEISNYIKANPIPSIGRKRKVIRKNMVVKFYGDNVAYLTYDQYNEKRSGEKFTYSKDVRIMEKHAGVWKIANVSSFWDYKDSFAEEEIER